MNHKFHNISNRNFIKFIEQIRVPKMGRKWVVGMSPLILPAANLLLNKLKVIRFLPPKLQVNSSGQSQYTLLKDS